MTCTWFNTKPFISTKSSAGAGCVGKESDLQNAHKEKTNLFLTYGVIRKQVLQVICTSYTKVCVQSSTRIQISCSGLNTYLFCKYQKANRPLKQNMIIDKWPTVSKLRVDADEICIVWSITWAQMPESSRHSGDIISTVNKPFDKKTNANNLRESFTFR